MVDATRAAMLFLASPREKARLGSCRCACASTSHRALVGQPFQADVRLESLTYGTSTCAIPLTDSSLSSSVRIVAMSEPICSCAEVEPDAGGGE